MTLRGPADAERFRTSYYRARYYTDPLPTCELHAEHADPNRLPAFTTIKKAVHSKTFSKRHGDEVYDLDPLRCAIYVADNKDALIALDREGTIRAVAGAAKADLRKAGKRGTHVHALLEDKAKGKELTAEEVALYLPESAPYVKVVNQFWAEQSPIFDLQEVVGLNWEHGYGCTSDVPAGTLANFPGEVCVIDYKTRGEDSNHGVYSEEGMQLAAAAHVDYVFVEDPETGQVRRMRPPAVTLGVIVSIKQDSYELFEVNLAEAWEAWAETCTAFRHKKAAEHHGRKALAKGPTFVQPVAPLTVGRAALESFTPDDIEDDGPDPQALTDYLSGQVRDLSAEGRTVLASLWPVGVQTFKAKRDAGEIHAIDQLHAIGVAIKAAQRAVGAPFPEPAPQAAVPTIAHDDPRIFSWLAQWHTLPEDMRPTWPPFSSGMVTVKVAEAFARELGDVAQALLEACAGYHAEHHARHPGDDLDEVNPTRSDILKAGRAAAKALGLPTPRDADDVLASAFLSTAVLA